MQLPDAEVWVVWLYDLFLTLLCPFLSPSLPPFPTPASLLPAMTGSTLTLPTALATSCPGRAPDNGPPTMNPFWSTPIPTPLELYLALTEVGMSIASRPLLMDCGDIPLSLLAVEVSPLVKVGVWTLEKVSYWGGRVVGGLAMD